MNLKNIPTNGRELAEDLASYLRQSGFLTFTEIQLPGTDWGRADVVAVRPHHYAKKDIRGR